MKWLKTMFLLFAAILGLSSAYSHSKRTTYIYVHICPNAKYNKIGTYDPAKCSRPDVTNCMYTVTVDLGPSTTVGVLLAAGGHGYIPNRCYLP
jgi:hypothetical protein